MMNMFFDPSYAYAFGGSNPFKRKRKKYANPEEDIFEKFIRFQMWLDGLEERKKAKEPKKEEKKPERKPDFVGLSMFLMVCSFFGGQASLLYLYTIFQSLPK